MKLIIQANKNFAQCLHHLMKSIGAVLLISLGASIPLITQAQETPPFVINDKEDFGNLVRDYLLENPKVIIEVIEILDQQAAQNQAQEEAAIIELYSDQLFNDKDSWAGGNLNGPITIVEYVDYRCGFCRRAHPVMKSLLQDRDDIKLIIKEFPILSEESIVSSRLAIAVLQLAGPETYKNVHDQLITLDSPITEEFVNGIAMQIEIPQGELENKMFDESVDSVIYSNQFIAADLGINATPTFIINNKIYRGYLEKDELLAIIDEG
ncbi:MAG: DsbA family protein [Rhodobacteraceae bacterium]|nr:DsbA family protein [Paracoccaceae bacterium]